MDPLSITASAIAVGGFVATISKGIKTLKSLGDAPDEFSALLNELTMLQMVAGKVEDLFVNQPTSDLRTFHEGLARISGKLEALSKRFMASSKGLDSRGRHKIPAIHWRREQRNIEQLRDQARESRNYLTSYLVAMNTSEGLFQSSLILDILRVSQASSDNLASQEHSTSSIASQLGLIQQQLQETVPARYPIARQPLNHHISDGLVCAGVSTLQSPPFKAGPRTSRLRPNGLKGLTPLMHQDGDDSHRQDYLHTDISLLYLGAVLRCDLTCRCRCHAATTFQAPRYAYNVVGHFSLSYTSTVRTKDGVCNYAGCAGPPTSKVQIHYHPPSWLAYRAVQFSISWDSTFGSAAIFSFRVPRVIDWSVDIWLVVRTGRLDYLRERLSTRQSHPTDVSEDGSTLLYCALAWQQWELARELLQAGSDVWARNEYGLSAGRYACEMLLLGGVTSGEGLRVCQQVVQVAEEEHTSTVIHDSVLGINGISVETAIKLEPTSLNSSDSLGNCPIHLAVGPGREKALDSLLHANADTEARDALFRTALHKACRHGNLTAVTRLLNLGSNIEARDVHHNTPLHFAVFQCLSYNNLPQAPSILAVLLKHKANVHAGNKSGCSPLLLFIEFHRHLLTEVEKSTIDALLYAGAYIDQADLWGLSPLLECFQREDSTKLFKFLRSRGASLKKVDIFQQSVLHYVAAWGDLELINFLRSLPTLDLDPDIKEERGKAPLDYLNWRLECKEDCTGCDVCNQWWIPSPKLTEEGSFAFRCLLDELRERRERDAILVESLPLRNPDVLLGSRGYW